MSPAQYEDLDQNWKQNCVSSWEQSAANPPMYLSELAAEHLAVLRERSRMSPQHRQQNLQPSCVYKSHMSDTERHKSCTKTCALRGKSLRNCGNEARKCSAPGSAEQQETIKCDH
jgi:hypothetical protein